MDPGRIGTGELPPEGSERAGRGSLGGLAPILGVGHIADPVDPILDGPVSA